MFQKILLESNLKNPILTENLWMMNFGSRCQKGQLSIECSGRQQGEKLCMGGTALQKERSAYAGQN